ncbi:MAG TPA: protein phosphatase 2C domain-containing protein [Chthonomonadales bacterium]|nr:protein phosphatase 2C domain-containing protein [Chthonomonadales bacterium]
MPVAEMPVRSALADASMVSVPLRQWRAASAALEGDAGAEGGSAVFWDVLPGGVLVSAIADGADAPRGAAGAAIATRHAAKCVRKRAEANGAPRRPADASSLLMCACHAARAALMAAAERLRVSPHDLDCALRVALCTPDMLTCASLGATGLHVEDASGRALDAPCHTHDRSAGPLLTGLDALERLRISVAHARVRRLILHNASAAEAVRRLLRGGDALSGALAVSRNEREATGRIEALLHMACAPAAPAVVLVAALDTPSAAALAPGARARRREAEPALVARAA